LGSGATSDSSDRTKLVMTGGIGFGVDSAALTLDILTTATAKYTALALTADQAGLVGLESSGITATGYDLHVLLNQASAGSLLDWSAQAGLSDVTASVSLAIGGTLQMGADNAALAAGTVRVAVEPTATGGRPHPAPPRPTVSGP